ncbi:MAG: FAD-dependent oxidoreductase, partial [Nannocystaceae bacterium]
MPTRDDGEREVFDLVIVGSGVGGLTAAIAAHELGLRAVVLEKSAVYGGSSAMSGGTLWIPNNHLQAAAGVDDSLERAWTYVRALAEDRGATLDAALMRRFLEVAPAAVAALERCTPLRFDINVAQPDYHPALAGGLAGGRSINARRFDGRRLGRELDRMRRSHPQTLIFGRVCVTPKEARRLAARSPAATRLLLRLFARYALDLPGRLRGPRDRSLAMGNALIGPLRLALLERDIPLRRSCPVTALMQEEGRVVGVCAARHGEARPIRARRGVLLAAGGFAGDQSLRDRYLPQPSQVAWSAANRDNQGDALRMGEAVGAATGLLDQAWLTPTLVVPGEPLAWLLVVERARPGCLLVDGRGRRFCSEGLPYEPAVQAIYQHQRAGAPAVPAWLLFDARYRRDYPCGPVLPGYAQPDARVPAPIRAALLRSAPSLEALARRIDVDPDVLQDTIRRFNDHAARGEDPDFGKGSDAYSRYYGDARVRPNPCLRPVTEAPFYAVPVMPGDLGTKGGLRIDPDARVLDRSGAPIPGLYATGNATASVMGATYPGAGATLAPSLAFGWIAAHT